MESSVWKQIQGIWKPLHGSFSELGISIEWHDYRIHEDMDWGKSFHPESLEICLNFAGKGSFQDGMAVRQIESNQVALYTTHRKRIQAVRHAGSIHRFLTLELSPVFLKTHLGSMLDQLKPPVQRFIIEEKAPPFLEIIPLPSALLASRMHFLAPPVPTNARDIWYRGRVLDILSQTIFREEEPGELFCHRHQRTNQKRVERVCFLIERDLENPPSLAMLAEEAACSPFYLSRIFAQEAGVSIPKFLRMKRIEKSCEFLKLGKMTVTEVAMMVGYSSLGAFNKAFVEQVGYCPGLYPNVLIAGRKQAPDTKSSSLRL